MISGFVECHADVVVPGLWYDAPLMGTGATALSAARVAWSAARPWRERTRTCPAPLCVSIGVACGAGLGPALRAMPEARP
jgi:hypothetical protein